MTDSLIKPRTLKGFRDFLPETTLARESLMATARDLFRSYGFSPIDTPALEYAEILLGKGGEESDKQLFRFTDSGGRDVAMRFDLTVPFARYAAQHLQDLVLPFKRYHIGTVWRGENPQRGRYREFMQCDFDTIGTDSGVADIETLLVIHDLMVQLGFQKFSVRVNHRGLLNGLLESLGLPEASAAILRVLDKLGKIGPQRVHEELTGGVGIAGGAADRVLEFADLAGPPGEVLPRVRPLVAGSPLGAESADRLDELSRAVSTAGIPPERVVLDVSIARGLDYYTGTIYETFLDDLPGIGSVCSGGRYDHLAELFTRQPLPGVGASLGLDRLLAAMDELGLLSGGSASAPVLIVLFDASRAGEYFRTARALREAGIGAEVYPQPRPLKKQLQYADRKGFRAALIAGPDEFERGAWQLKDLSQGQQSEVSEEALVDELRRLLGS